MGIIATLLTCAIVGFFTTDGAILSAIRFLFLLIIGIAVVLSAIGCTPEAAFAISIIAVVVIIACGVSSNNSNDKDNPNTPS